MTVTMNKDIKLSEHFTLGEMTVTTYHTDDGNIPSRVAIENLTNLCEVWLEELRCRYNLLYGQKESPIVINSGFRSPEVNQKCGGAKNSNHLTGCAVDIHCAGKEQAIRYACILLDIADGKKLDFDELILEKRGTTIWVHFAVRPKGNRQYVHF
jgi:hypothetical protein